MAKTMGLRLGRVIEGLGRRIAAWGGDAGSSASPFAVFLDGAALELNRARLDHLDSLGIEIEGRSVLEVGAGIGLLTGYFEDRGCRVVSTDGRPENVAEILKRHPHRKAVPLDLDALEEIEGLGFFDIVFCYGTLYHLARPAEALGGLARISDTILLSTCVTPGAHVAVHLVRESSLSNQAVGEIGCRPTRPWIMEQLARGWGHAYVSRYQPVHDDFETNWLTPFKHGNHRAVFVGSRSPLKNPMLSPELLDIQERTPHPEPAQSAAGQSS